MALIYALPGAVAEGLIWGLMAIGVYISYKILDIADLTVDGSICTGACVCAVLIALGVPVWVSVLVAFAAGAVAGAVAGVLHTALGIPSILAGILTQLMLYSVNLSILGGKSLIAIDPRANNLIVHMSNNPKAILSMTIVVTAVIIILWKFFYINPLLEILICYTIKRFLVTHIWEWCLHEFFHLLPLYRIRSSIHPVSNTHHCFTKGKWI